MPTVRSSLAFLLLCFAAQTAFAQGRPYTPERGSAVRSEIMNALRTNVRDVPGLGAQTIFSVYRFSVLGDWALITVDPRNRDGSPTSRYDSHIEESGCDHEIIALLQRGNSGWRVVERAVGPCDSALEIWLSQHGVSERILDKWGGMENWLGPR